MIEKLIEVLIQFWSVISPFFIVPEYESAIILRLGKYTRDAHVGLNWKLPFFDAFLTCYSTLTTIKLPPQTLITSDKRTVVISAIIKYRIVDAKLFLLQVNHDEDVLNDITQGNIMRVVADHSYSDLLDVISVIRRKTRKEVKPFGFDVEAITFVDIGPIKTVRLLGVTHEQF